MKIGVILVEQFEPLEAISTIDVLRRGGINVDIISMNDTIEVISAHNISIKCDILFKEITEYDALVLPGGAGTKNYYNYPKLEELLNLYNANNKLICAICAAPTYLDSIKLTTGKTVVCFPALTNLIKNGKLGTKNVEIDGNIITSKGPATSIEFGLAIVEMLCGKSVRDEVATGMLF